MRILECFPEIFIKEALKMQHIYALQAKCGRQLFVGNTRQNSIKHTIFTVAPPAARKFVFQEEKERLKLPAQNVATNLLRGVKGCRMKCIFNACGRYF